MRSLIAPELEQSLRAILISVDYGILFTDTNHRSLICNARFGEHFGISPEDVVSQDAESVRAMVYRRIADADAWQKNLDQVYAEPELEQEDELHLVNPECVLRRYTGPVRNESGEVTGRLWTFLDITNQVRKRQQREALHRTALYFDHDPKQVCQFIADEISRQYGGIALVSLLEDTFLRFHTASGIPEGIPPMSGNQLRDSFCQFCLRAKSPLIIQDARTNPESQNLMPVQLGLTRYAGVPIYRSGGTIVGTLCILDGRSEQILTEEDLQFLSLLAMRISAELDRQDQLDSLQTDLDDTNKELQATQQRLIQSEKLAITGTLSASIAHDIRNILASMNLQIDMGSHDPAKALAYVQDSLKRFNVLAHRLMSYAKPKQAMLEHINLAEVLNRVTSLLSSQFNVSKVNLHVEHPDAPAFILGDEGRLEHLFVNLLINALQSLKPGGDVYLTTFVDGNQVVVMVRDTGEGIPPDRLATLFQPFVSTKKDGFGLGLFSCKQIASDHHAQLNCHSTPGEGTTFRVAFQQS